MEEINESIKQVLSFLYVVQNSIDDYRQLLEQTYQSEYHTFVENWKKDNKQKKQDQNTKLKPDLKEDSVVEVSQPINIVELEHADRILERARKIRKQVTGKQSKSGVHLVDSKQNVNQFTKKLSLQKGHDTESTSFEVKKDAHKKEASKYKMSSSLQKQSKSTAGHPRNLQVNVAKSLRLSKGQAAASNSTERKSSSAISKQKLPCHSNTAVVSKEKFLSLKSLQIADDTSSSSHLSVTHRKINSKALNSLPLRCQQAGLSQVSVDQRLLPTYKEFHKMLDEFQKEGPFKLNKKWAWYTFLSSKSEVHLSRIIRCDSYEDLKKVWLLLAKIQESMFWLDLFNLVGKEVLPHLQKLDKNQKSTAIIIQYLQSIFLMDCRPSAAALMH